MANNFPPVSIQNNQDKTTNVITFKPTRAVVDNLGSFWVYFPAVDAWVPPGFINKVVDLSTNDSSVIEYRTDLLPPDYTAISPVVNTPAVISFSDNNSLAGGGTASLVSIGNAGSVTISGTPNVNIGNTPNVNIVNIPAVTINAGSQSIGSVTLNSGTQSIGSISAIGSTVTIAGTINIGNTPSVTVTGTPTVNIGAANTVVLGAGSAVVGTINIGNTPSVSISSGSVSISSGTVNVQNVPASLLAINSPQTQLATQTTAGSTLITYGPYTLPAGTHAIGIVTSATINGFQIIGQTTTATYGTYGDIGTASGSLTKGYYVVPIESIYDTQINFKISTFTATPCTWWLVAILDTQVVQLDASYYDADYNNPFIAVGGIDSSNRQNRVATIARYIDVSGFLVNGLSTSAATLNNQFQVEQQQTPSIFKFNSVALAAGAAMTVWTPATGKKFRLLSCILTASALAGLELRDNVTSFTAQFILQPNTSLDVSSLFRENGYLSSAINNPLTVKTGNAATIQCTVSGTEE